MTTLNWSIVIALTVLMIAAAIGVGRWAEAVNPEGITPPTTSEETVAAQDTQDAFSFGASIGLLGSALLYATVAIGMLIQAKTSSRPPYPLTYWIAGLAGTGLALSYLVDDYFY